MRLRLGLPALWAAMEWSGVALMGVGATEYLAGDGRGWTLPVLVGAAFASFCSANRNQVLRAEGRRERPVPDLDTPEHVRRARDDLSEDITALSAAAMRVRRHASLLVDAGVEAHSARREADRRRDELIAEKRQLELAGVTFRPRLEARTASGPELTAEAARRSRPHWPQPARLRPDGRGQVRGEITLGDLGQNADPRDLDEPETLADLARTAEGLARSQAT